MEEDLKKMIEEIKEETINEEETKKYIFAIKRVFKKVFENCKDEYTESEILEMYLEEYNNNLLFRGNAEDIFYNTLKYDALKTILADFSHDKAKFNQEMREAKRREEEDRTGRIAFRLDAKESTISCIRYTMRKGKTTNESDIIENIKQEKKKIEEELKSKMIKTIQGSVKFLEEYGFIDEYIETSNVKLEKLGLSGLKLIKRNPIAEEQYIEGQLVKDVEDLGVIDTFSTENLSNIPTEDLQIMSTFYLSKYFEERLGISKAMSTIKTLELWDVMAKEDDNVIQALDNNRINSALKKDLALTYLCQNGIEISPKIKEQYQKFLNENNINTDSKLEDDREAIQAETSNLNQTAVDIRFLVGLLIYQLKEKHAKIKRWGIINNNLENKKEVGEIDNYITIALENQNFRGPLLIGVPNNILTEVFGEGKNIKFPEYKGRLNQEYCDVMSKLYLPTNKFFSNFIKKAYEEEPQSEIIANLAGKKVKEGR